MTTWKGLWVSCAATACLCVALCFVLPGNHAASAVEGGAPPPANAAQPAVVQIPEPAMRMLQSAYQHSLEKRENVDFLLSPALLMQEAMSPELIVTYPEE